MTEKSEQTIVAFAEDNGSSAEISYEELFKPYAQFGLTYDASKNELTYNGKAVRWFEDYSFSKHLLYGIAKAHMLWLFLALYAENKKALDTDEIAKVIAVYERRAPQIEDALKML